MIILYYRGSRQIKYELRTCLAVFCLTNGVDFVELFKQNDGKRLKPEFLEIARQPFW